MPPGYQLGTGDLDTPAPFLEGVSGRLERHEGVANVIAERIEALDVAASVASRDFR